MSNIFLLFFVWFCLFFLVLFGWKGLVPGGSQVGSHSSIPPKLLAWGFERQKEHVLREDVRGGKVSYMHTNVIHAAAALAVMVLQANNVRICFLFVCVYRAYTPEVPDMAQSGRKYN